MVPLGLAGIGGNPRQRMKTSHQRAFERARAATLTALLSGPSSPIIVKGPARPLLDPQKIILETAVFFARPTVSERNLTVHSKSETLF